MKVVKDYPPNYETIRLALNLQGNKTRFFCYGDAIYSPDGTEPPEDVIYHEHIHELQQGKFPDNWWAQYLTNKDFRLKQEIEAYGAQYKVLKDAGIRGKGLQMVLTDLATSLSMDYNLPITLQQAESKIRNYGLNRS